MLPGLSYLWYLLPDWMASERYNCSNTMIRARWWGNVIGPMESLKSAAAFTLGDMPKEEPIKKQALLFPESFTSYTLAAKASEDITFPSGVSTQNQAPFGILLRIRSASFSKPAEISAAEGFSGRRNSGNSMI